MNSPMIYTTSEQAQAEADAMRGWSNIRVLREEPEYPTDPEGWIIRCDGGVMCDDGYVRDL